jgi:alkylhydroperoxidase family enzyme
VGRELGLGEEQLRDLSRHGESDAFTPLEKLALDLAEAMTRSPVEVPDALFRELRRRLTDAQLVELTATIAWENYRARFNHALGIEAQGFSEGAYCPLPGRGAEGAAEP